MSTVTEAKPVTAIERAFGTIKQARQKLEDDYKALLGRILDGEQLDAAEIGRLSAALGKTSEDVEWDLKEAEALRQDHANHDRCQELDAGIARLGQELTDLGATKEDVFSLQIRRLVDKSLNRPTELTRKDRLLDEINKAIVERADRGRARHLADVRDLRRLQPELERKRKNDAEWARLARRDADDLPSGTIAQAVAPPAPTERYD